VLIPLRDRVIPPRHQRWIAEQIPDAHAVTVDAGHAGCTMQWKEFVPGLAQPLFVAHIRGELGAYRR
jgi:pimeloyl-ACP methyl ester carboxylesterase